MANKKKKERPPKGSWKKEQTICDKDGHHDYVTVKRDKGVFKKGDMVCVYCGYTVKREENDGK